MKERLEKRFAFLYKGERFAIIMFIPPAFLIPNAYPNLQLYSLFSYWTSFLILEFILIQGTYYWYSKWKCLTKEEKSLTPVKTVQHLKKLKPVNIGILIFAIMTLLVDIYIHYPDLPVGGLLLSGFIATFAFLEFINYYYIQLSYDNRSDLQYLIKNKKLKRSYLNQDMKRIS